MHAGGTRCGDAHTAIHGAEQHVVARIEILSIRESPPNAARNQRNRLQGEQLTEWISFFRGIALNGMAQGIHAGRGGNRRR